MVVLAWFFHRGESHNFEEKDRISDPVFHGEFGGISWRINQQGGAPQL